MSTNARVYYFALVLVLSLVVEPLTGQILRVASYNLADNPTNPTDDQNLQAVLAEIGATQILGSSRPLDLMGFQEGPSSTNNYTFVEQDFEQTFGGNYAFTLSTADQSGDRTGFIYNVNTLQLLSSVNLSGGLTHNILRSKFRHRAVRRLMSSMLIPYTSRQVLPTRTPVKSKP